MSKFARPNQLKLVSGEYVATISAYGAALIQLAYRGNKFCPERDTAELLSSYHGSVIAPWPNRIRDGQYCFAGKQFSVPINEKTRGNALHGFSAELQWATVQKNDAYACFELSLPPSPGYPWPVTMTTEYQLSPAGLELSFSATGTAKQPFGWAFHPYLTLPNSKPATWMLQHSAKSVLLVDSKRLLPTSLVSVEKAGLDFRFGASPEITGLDNAFANFDFNEQGRSSITLESSQHLIKVDFDSATPWLQLHFPDAKLTSVPAVVVEPMSCAPDAFNSPDYRGVDLEAGFRSVLKIQVNEKRQKPPRS